METTRWKVRASYTQTQTQAQTQRKRPEETP
jgi:hypothetical protein